MYRILGFFIAGVACMATPAYFFDGALTEVPTSYLYAHGLFAGEVQMAKYCPRFVASTGEVVSCDTGGQVIGECCSAVTFAEINSNKFSFSWNPRTWPLNVIRACGSPIMQHVAYRQYGIKITANPASDKTIAGQWFSLKRLNMGQVDDIALLQAAYDQHREKYPHTDIVLYGVSRGSAAAVNFLACHQPSQVKAVVLEGVFDDIPHLLKHFGFSCKGRLVESISHAALNAVAGGYNKNGPFPSRSLDALPQNIPLLLVTSLKDWEVPYQCTFRLYRKLKEIGHEKVHLLVLHNAGHSNYMIGDTEDKRNYESVVHSFYRHYGLAYNAALADQGQELFSKTMPTFDELAKNYQLTAGCCCS